MDCYPRLSWADLYCFGTTPGNAKGAADPRRFDFRARGDPLDAKVEGDRIVLTPSKARLQKVRIIEDPVTGLPVLTAGPDAPPLTSKQVEDILADFP
jgi:hypothetical protein